VSEGDFAIAWTAPARRALARLPEKVATAPVEFVYGSLAADPRRVGKPLKLGLAGLHSARRGDYRVIYRMDDQRHLVTVVAIEHRSDVYRPRQFLEPPLGGTHEAHWCQEGDLCRPGGPNGEGRAEGQARKRDEPIVYSFKYLMR
jgi:mRNA interferase RelE/StbE